MRSVTNGLQFMWREHDDETVQTSKCRGVIRPDWVCSFHYATESKTGSAAWTTEVATHHFKDILEAQRVAIEAHTPLEDIERPKLSHEDDLIRLLLGQRDWVEQFKYTIQDVQVEKKGGLLYTNAYVTRNFQFESGVTTGHGNEMTIQLQSPNDAIEEVEPDNQSVTQSNQPFFKRWISRVFKNKSHFPIGEWDLY